MELHSLSNSKGTRQPRSRVGRGRSSGSGKTSGRGTKGQKSRSGYRRKLGFEGGQMPLVRRLPKRGFNNPFGTVYVPVNVHSLNRFDAESTVTVELLQKVGLAKGTDAKVKILGHGGDVAHALTVQAHAFSNSARTKIEAVGGTCEIVA